MSEQEHTKELFFIFDVESVGLHGEGYAYGFVVVDEYGIELDAGRCSCDPAAAEGDASGRNWIAKNCPDIPVSEPTPKAVRCRFADEWEDWQKHGAVMVADCPWPVESRFLSDCIRDLQMSGPYPLIDVASVVLASGRDPVATFDRLENELPKHDPLADARQSARIFIESLTNITTTSLTAHRAAVDALREAAREALDALKIADVHVGWTDCSLENVHGIIRENVKSLTAALAGLPK